MSDSRAGQFERHLKSGNSRLSGKGLKATGPLKLRERDIERTCSDLLALDGWRLLKTDPCSDRARGKGFGEKGMADCLYIRYDPINDVRQWAPLTTSQIIQSFAQVMWIEWKRPGGVVSALQRAWHAAERARGALTLIAGEDFRATIEGFQSWYRASGLNRGRV